MINFVSVECFSRFPLVISLVPLFVFLVFFAGSTPFMKDRAIRVLPYINTQLALKGLARALSSWPLPVVSALPAPGAGAGEVTVERWRRCC